MKLYNKKLLFLNEEVLSKKTKIEVQRDEIQDKKNVIDKQLTSLSRINIELKQKNEHIEASLRFAKKIQDSLLPNYEEILPKYFSDFFLYYLPREKVSGDFYWMIEKEDFLYLAVADCTGHGIPGALLSFLGISSLNEIINIKPNIKPDEILVRLRDAFILNFHKDNSYKHGNQSIDISIVQYNASKQELTYSGSYNSIFLVRENRLTEFKADKIPIGQSEHTNVEFNLYQHSLRKGDQFYLFSDGFQDQIGGAKTQKFLKKKFRFLIEGISSYSPTEQQNILSVVHKEWRGEIQQIDDITILGIKI